jgi:hypothetical protein
LPEAVRKAHIDVRQRDARVDVDPLDRPIVDKSTFRPRMSSKAAIVFKAPSTFIDYT